MWLYAYFTRITDTFVKRKKTVYDIMLKDRDNRSKFKCISTWLELNVILSREGTNYLQPIT